MFSLAESHVLYIDNGAHSLTAESYARKKMEGVCKAAVELQAALEEEPLTAGYNLHVETLAIATKSAINLASQVSN
jgi:hypothetical protein